MYAPIEEYADYRCLYTCSIHVGVQEYAYMYT